MWQKFSSEGCLFETPFPMLLCSSLTYNAKEIRMLLKEEEDETSKWTVEWIIIDPASFTGNRPEDITLTYINFVVTYP